MRLHIIRNERIENIGKSQSCMVSKLRMICKQTVASSASSSGVGSVAKFWTVEVNTDQSENNEVTLNMRQIKGEKAIAARADYVQKHGGGEAQYEMHAKDAVKSGVLLKNRPRGFQLVWQPRFFVLSKRFLVYYLDQRTREEHPERCVSISSVMRA